MSSFSFTNWPDAVSQDDVITSGTVVGDTLVITTALGTTINIDVSTLNSTIDFNNLNPVQKAALLDCVRGDLVSDAFGTDLGHLVPL